MKKVIVTGDSGALGEAISRTLLEQGYGVIGISRSENDNVRKLRQEFGENYVHICFDLERSDRISELYYQILKPLGPIYGLVNNSAYAYDDLVTNAKLEEMEKMFKINFFSAVILTKYIIRDMLLHNTKGVIVHISSVSAHTGYKGLSMYAASKGALEAFSKSVAREWGERGIRSNCVAPGFMETPMNEKLSQEQKQRIYRRTSLKQPTSVQSVAKTVAFLLSEEAESITGTTILVDSGTL